MTETGTAADLAAMKIPELRKLAAEKKKAEEAEQRKQAIADYKKRESAAGVFAIRCRATGAVWVGQALDLEKIQNRIWFTLRMGNHRNAELQRAWAAHGADNLSLETLERIKDEELAYVRDTLLKERVAHWRTQLDAAAV